MELEIFLLYSKEPSAFLYPETDEFNSPHHMLRFKIDFNVILPSKRGLTKWPPFFRFLHQNFVFSLIRCHTSRPF